MHSPKNTCHHNFLRHALFGIGLTMATTPVIAATTGAVTPKGTVPAILEVSVTPTVGFDNLDLTVAAVDLEIAQVNERTNNKGGYTVTVDSTNGVADSLASGRFISSTDPVSNTDTLDYTLKYGGTTATLANGSGTVTDATGKTTGTGVTNSVQISYDGSGSFLTADSYEDTLTFTIAAK